VVVSLDMTVGREISIRQDVRLKYAASKKENLKPASIVLIIPVVW